MLPDFEVEGQRDGMLIEDDDYDDYDDYDEYDEYDCYGYK